MKDQFGRVIDYMRVSVTDRCNLRCVYCMPEDGVPAVSHHDILTFDEIARLCRIGAGLGITKIKLTGGEPLVRRGLPDLLGMIKAIPEIEQVTLTTNGILLKQQINELVDKGLDSVNISIDTLDPEKYRKVTRGGSVEQALEGLDAAAAFADLRVKINCVPLKDAEEEEYIRLALLAKDGKADVRFIEMMPIGMGKAFSGKSGDEICGMLERRFGKPEQCTKTLGNGPAAYVQFPGFQKRVGFISAVSHQFCGGCNRVRLTSEGYLKACLQYGSGADLRTLIRSGSADDVIGGEMRRVMYEKPACHQFASGNRIDDLESKGMSRIGG